MLLTILPHQNKHTMELLTEEELEPKLRPVKRFKRYLGGKCIEVPERVKNLLNCNQVSSSRIFQPIVDIERYIDALGVDPKSKRADELRDLHKIEKEEVTIEDIPQKVSFKDPSYVSVQMKLVGKKIKIKIIAPLDEYEMYRKKGKMPPLAVRIRAAKASGFPDSVLEKMIIRDDKWKANMEDMNKFLLNIFGAKPSKPSKPKAKSVQEALTSIMRKKTQEYKRSIVNKD